MDVRGRYEGVDARFGRVTHGGPGGVDVAAIRARRSADDRAIRCSALFGDRIHGFPVTRRGRRKARLDDIDLEPRQLAGYLQFLVAGHRAARRLLAVAQSRIENTYMVTHSSTPFLCSALARCYFARVDKGHHAPQFAPDLLDRVVAVDLAHTIEIRPAGVVFFDPFLGEGSALNVLEQLTHGRSRLLGDDPGAGGVVAVLGRIADRVAHIVEATLVEEVDDQLQLVHT